MIFNPFRIIPKKFLGIDIGTSSIKLVELSRWGERKKLENYGEIRATALYKEPFRTFEKSTLLLSDENISKAIHAVLKEAKITTRKAVFSIPDFSSFFTSFELPAMTREELSQAVLYEAKRYVPMPLGEVTLDWQAVDNLASKERSAQLKILLVAVPNEIINQYRSIAQMTDLELLALEAEVFGLLHSLAAEEKEPVALLDIGAQSSTSSIIFQKTLRTSHSFDLSGNALTEQVSRSLSIDYGKAEEVKEKYGLLPNKRIDSKKNIEIREVLTPLIDVILRETNKTCVDFHQKEGREIKRVVLAGGTALLPGLKEYAQEYFKKEVEIANPFVNILYPPILEETLKKMGPSYAIAVGMALRGIK
jgi:type IV pilus assembly protein PilM